MVIHVIETGRLIGNRMFMRAQGFSEGLLRRRVDEEFPVHSFVVEHPEGTFAIDAGLGAPVPIPKWQRRFVPTVVGGSRRMDDELRARGLDPATVSPVILTHLGWDHVGGVDSFPHAEVLVHRPEHAAAMSRQWRARYRPDLWPAGFAPTLFDLGDVPLGPFPRSRTLTHAGDVHVVALWGTPRARSE